MRRGRFLYFAATLVIAIALPACTTMAPPATAPEQVLAALSGMAAAANAHDVDRHVGYYAHDSSTLLIVDGEAVRGWDAIYVKQREWWNGGNTDVVYTLQGKPEVRSLAPGLATSTIFMKSTRSTASGAPKEGSFAVSAIWKRFPEGWRVIYSHESTSR